MLRIVLALAAVVVLSWAVGPSGGMYTHLALGLAVTATALAVTACLIPQRLAITVSPRLGAVLIDRALILLAVLSLSEAVRKSDPVAIGTALGAAIVWGLWRLRSATPPLGLALLAAAALLLSGQAVLFAEVLYGSPGPSRTALMLGGAGTGFLLTSLWLLDISTSVRRPDFWSRVVLLFVAGGVLRVSAILASPEPIVDVHVALRDAPAHLWNGQNPYTAVYPDPYDSDRARALGIHAPPENAAYPFYPPLPFLIALPFHVAGLDVRYANVVCDLLAAAALFAAARDRLAGAIVAGIYLHLPRVPFLIEHAWYEPMLAALLGWGLVLLDRGRTLPGWLLLGLGLTGKQFGLPMLPPVAAGQRQRLVSLVLGIAAALLLMIPFLLWDFRAFLDVILLRHLGRPVQLDSITLAAGANNLFGLTLPRPLLLGCAAVLIGLVTWRTPRGGAVSALWAGTCLLVFCLFHTQGYFNYFCLCQYLLLLGVAAADDFERAVVLTFAGSGGRLE